MDLNIIGELLIRYPVFVIYRYLREKLDPNSFIHSFIYCNSINPTFGTDTTGCGTRQKGIIYI